MFEMQITAVNISITKTNNDTKIAPTMKAHQPFRG
jgi:hypothetical protein